MVTYGDDDLVELIEQLVAIDSVNPDLVAGAPGEKSCARFVGDWLAERGVPVDYQTLAPGRENIIARLSGHGGGRSLMLNAHLDTVGFGGMNDPLQPRRQGNHLYGRGAQDTKSGLAACMIAIAAAREQQLRGDVILAGVADEEAHSIGSQALIEQHTADAAIVIEPTGHAIITHHKGFVWLDITTVGVAAHGSDYLTGIDAITAMGPVLTALADHQQQLITSPGSPTLGPASLHAGLINGGAEMSTYPAGCQLSVERRTVDGESAGDVRAEIQALVDRHSPIEATVQVTFAREPLATPRDAPIVDTLTEQWRQVTRSEATIGSQPAWTDAAVLSSAGIPAVVFGPTGEGLHGDNEYVDIDSVATACDVLRATISGFCT